MPETMELRGRTKKLIEKTKSGQKVPSLEAVEVFLLYAFIFNKSDAYLLNTEPSNLVFLKFQNTEFDELS